MMRESELERQYGLKILQLKPHKGVYLLSTTKGNKCLKKINYGVQKLSFVSGAKEHLINNGFKNVDRYLLTTEGLTYGTVNDDIYTISEWIEGRECNFCDLEEIKMASRKLAELHEASKGYEPPENSKLKTDLGRWQYLMQKRIQALDKMKDIARKKSIKTQFDLDYVKAVSMFEELGKRAQKILNESKYMELCAYTEEKKIFCHHDYTYHNIIIDEKNEMHVIDFDYCKRETRVYDVAQFIIKVLKRNEWNTELAVNIIESYNEIEPLTSDEYDVILAFLVFPQRFWRLANRYYYNEVSWPISTYCNKLNNLVNEKEKYVKFLEEFSNEFNKKI